MESLQSLLPAVLPCKHQRCVVPTLDEELWQIVAINSRDLEMLNFLDALWMPLSPRPSSAYEHPGSPDQEFLIFWPILNISCFPPEAAPSLTLQVAPGSKFRCATLTSTPLLAYDICLQQTHCGSIYDLWFLAVRLSVNLAHCHGQVLGIEWNWHVEIPLVAHDGSLATVCEPHTALDFPEKMQKVLSQIYMFKLQLSARQFSDPENK